MLCKDIIAIIEQKYPVSCAMNWDNVGLLVGTKDKDVSKIYVALDVTDEVLYAAIECGADMIVTHHPLIFSGMKKVVSDDFIGNRVIKMIEHGISYYAMHTNYDVMGMSDLSGEFLEFEQSEVLDVTCEENPVDHTPKGIGKVADLNEKMSLRDYCQVVKERFQLESVKVFGNLDMEISRVAISPGSGKSMIGAALASRADVLVTGDIDHHTGIDAVAQGLAIIDAGHYGIEHIFIHDMAEYLKKNVTDAVVIEAPINHPFHVL